MASLSGAFAACVTPLRDDGNKLDEGAVAPIIDFLANAGLDGLLALGTTGEGILLSQHERRRAAELILQAADSRLAVAIHCGAQTTADTVALAAHAAEIGAAAISVIGPPYFALDQHALVEHFSAAAKACAPLPFYVYEFAARSGYQVPVAAIERLRQRAPNLAGLKVSDTPWERFETYLIDGLDVFVGPEALIDRGLERGAVGAISGLAAAFPDLVSEVVHTPSAEGARRLGEVRAAVQQFPFQAALKLVLAHRNIPVRPDVRAPLRQLNTAEADRLSRALNRIFESAGDLPQNRFG